MSIEGKLRGWRRDAGVTPGAKQKHSRLSWAGAIAWNQATIRAVWPAFRLGAETPHPAFLGPRNTTL